MKVLINGVAVRRGGTETWLASLVPALARVGENVEFTLIVRKSRAQLYSPARNLEIIAVPDESVRVWWKRLAFEHCWIPIRNIRYRSDVHFQADEMLSPVITRLGISTVAVFHTTSKVLSEDLRAGLLRGLYARFLRNRAPRNASMLVTVSQEMAADISGYARPFGCKLRIIPHGVNHELFYCQPAEAQPLRRFGVLRPYLLSISNRFPWKNYARLVEAFHRALTGFRDEADLVLIGNPVDEAVERNIAGYIREHNLLTRVHILKGLPQTDLPRIYSGARAYVFPSLAESFGMTVLEAMACGVPVAVSNREPLPEICGEAAVYFDPLNTDQMSTCLLAVEGDERLRSSLIQKGIARAHSFTWEHAAEQYLEVLGEVARS